MTQTVDCPTQTTAPACEVSGFVPISMEAFRLPLRDFPNKLLERHAGTPWAFKLETLRSSPSNAAPRAVREAQVYSRSAQCAVQPRSHCGFSTSTGCESIELCRDFVRQPVGSAHVARCVFDLDWFNLKEVPGEGARLGGAAGVGRGAPEGTPSGSAADVTNRTVYSPLAPLRFLSSDNIILATC